MPRFDSKYGPGTVVTVGARNFAMPYTTEDTRDIGLLSKHPGVFVVPEPEEPVAQPVAEEPSEGTPAVGLDADVATSDEVTETKTKPSRKEARL